MSLNLEKKLVAKISEISLEKWIPNVDYIKQSQFLLKESLRNHIFPVCKYTFFEKKRKQNTTYTNLGSTF